MTTLAQLGEIAKADDRQRQRRRNQMVGTAALAGAGGTLYPAYKYSDQWMRANQMKPYYESGNRYHKNRGESEMAEAAQHQADAMKHKENWRKMYDSPTPINADARKERTEYLKREWDRGETADWHRRNASERARFHFDVSHDEAARAAKEELRRKKFKGKTLTTLGGTAVLGGLAAHQFSQAHKNKQRR